jgi:hypothetical protein
MTQDNLNVAAKAMDASAELHVMLQSIAGKLSTFQNERAAVLCGLLNMWARMIAEHPPESLDLREPITSLMRENFALGQRLRDVISNAEDNLLYTRDRYRRKLKKLRRAKKRMKRLLKHLKPC